MVLTSQSHLGQHVLHDRHCHVTFSALSSLSFFHTDPFTYLPFGFWPFHLLSLFCVSAAATSKAVTESLTCIIFRLIISNTTEPSLFFASAHVYHNAPYANLVL
ncbi:hypothetical protein VNO78_26462 [Psophocarpus tetragonolobus]|uniref:Uncharacterized protein n=1 Tax=Psophocarpus tetragonolobus TaxID=3891 RepID=A0AAN9S0K0_PSOTE